MDSPADAVDSAAGVVEDATGTPAPASVGNRRRSTYAAMALLAVGMLLRLHDLTTTPSWPNWDELALVWNGQSLLRTGQPTSWSFLTAYPDLTIYNGYGAAFPMHVHWFDHPPLFSAIVGGLTLLFGESMDSVLPQTVRIVPLVCSGVGMLLAYLLVRRISPTTGLLTLALLALSPAAWAYSHIAVGEALIAPMLLGAMLLAVRETVGQHFRGQTVLLLVLCTLAPTAKVTGVCVGVSATAWLLLHRRWRLGMLTAITPVLGVGLFVLYGWLIDWNLFVAVWQSQSDRHNSILDTGWQFISSASAGLEGFDGLFDPLWWAGWCAVVLVIPLCFVRRSRLVLLLPLLVYLGTVAGSAGTDPARYYAWYRIPAMPFVYAFLAMAFELTWLPLLGTLWARLRTIRLPISARPAS